MNEDFMEDLWASIFDASDYQGDIGYADIGEYNLATGGELGWVYDADAMSLWGRVQDEIGFDVPNLDELDFEDMDSAIDWINSIGFDLNLEGITDDLVGEIRAWTDNYFIEMEPFQNYWNWKDKYAKYVSPYDAKKEGYVREDTDLKIKGLTSQFEDTLRSTSSAAGRLNLDSGRARNLWGDVKKGLDLQIKKQELAEDMDILNLREAYKSRFYGDIMEYATLDPGMLDPDQG